MIDREALIGEMVCLHHMDDLFKIPLSIIQDFMAYNKINKLSSGFTDLKVTELDVGKSVLAYLVDILPHLSELSKWQYKTILKLPEARSQSSQEEATEQ